MITSPLSFGAADLTLAMQMNTFQDAMRQLDILTQPDKLLDNLAKLPMIAASMIVVVGFLCVLNG
ncbi:MAG: hypothetical protein L0219_21155, partial [Phycisphaerales bacterium]|nr:hypothetical protein [Phycisphaerales bacterium]